MDNNEIKQIERLTEQLKGAKRAVAMTGAGISVPSGIPDFRSATGLYHTKFGEFEPETMISHSFFVRHTADFFRFYREKMLYPDAKPNDAHILLAELERMGCLNAVVTQNIDGLHQMAGSKNVLELHGSVHRNTCMKCGAHYGQDCVIKGGEVPRCRCGGIIKPDVVLYEESLDNDVLYGAVEAIERADVFLVIGTSLKVYPAAGLVNYFGGNFAAVINKGETPFDGEAQMVIDDDCGKVARMVLDRL